VSTVAFAQVGTDNRESAQDNDTIAVVSGKKITNQQLLPAIQGELFQLKVREFELKQKALDQLVDKQLLEQQAKKKGITPEELLRQEVDSKVADPSEAELKALYIVQKEQLKRPFSELREPLSKVLKNAKLQDARQSFYQSLRGQNSGQEVKVLLQKPKFEFAPDPVRLRGDPNAPIQIVEYSDYQCPFCRSAEPTLKALLAKYPGQVNLSYRDLPLREIHPQADESAEAARCAGDQDKFWEYHDLLFENQGKLKHEDLLQHARNLKLEEKQFSACLASRKYKDLIQQEMQVGFAIGVTGTPGFFINGTLFGGNVPLDQFERAIQAELGMKTRSGGK